MGPTADLPLAYAFGDPESSAEVAESLDRDHQTLEASTSVPGDGAASRLMPDGRQNADSERAARNLDRSGYPAPRLNE
jgi:hypothetical protein